MGAIYKLWWSTLYGIVVWAVLAAPAAYFLYLIFKTIFFSVEKNMFTGNARKT